MGNAVTPFVAGTFLVVLHCDPAADPSVDAFAWYVVADAAKVDTGPVGKTV
jgi:hypothetical protein